MPSPTFRQTFNFVASYWRPYRLAVLGLFGAQLVITATELTQPWLLGRLLDALAAHPAGAPLGSILTIFYGIIGLSAAFWLLTVGRWLVVSYLEPRAAARLGAEAFARVQRFGTAWHASAFVGSTVRRIARGMRSFETFSDHVFFEFLPLALLLAGSVGFLLWRFPQFGGWLTLGIGVYVAVSITLAVRWVMPTRQAENAADSAVAGGLSDSLACRELVQSCGAEAREDRRLTGLLAAWRAASQKTYFAGSYASLIQNTLIVLMKAGFFGGGIWLWQQGLLTVGQVATVFGLYTLISGHLRDVGQRVREILQATSDLADVVEFAETKPAVADQPGAQPLVCRRGELVFDRISFTYPGQARPIFHNFSLTIPAGQRLALVGHSGSGKTTFFKLLTRAYDLSAGTIHVDGQNIAAVQQTSLRANLALVPQEPILFHRSLAENIGYARPGASLAAIKKAARLAHAAEFIERLPQKYETLVGERGVKLSGGERQRVALARAILADAPVLLLDEATAALDSQSERLIQAALDTLLPGRTSITIAHRLSTVRAADRIVVLDRGRIVEDGTHAQLLRLGGVYAQLYRLQAGGFLGE